MSTANERPIVVVCGVIRADCEDTERTLFLLGKRAPGGAFGGLWECPGGKVEPGETPLAAIRREIYEELGILVGKAKLLQHTKVLTVETGRYPAVVFGYRIDDHHPEGRRWEYSEAVQSLDGSHTELRWFTYPEVCALEAVGECIPGCAAFCVSK